MVKTTYNTTEDMKIKLQHLKCKTKLKIFEKIGNYYDEINIRNFKFEEDYFSKNAQGISKICHEVFLLMNFLQAKSQVKNMNIKY